MPFTQLTLTNVGKREMLKQGELVVTGMAVGNGSTNAENATALAAQFVRKVPTVTNEGDKKVVEIVIDNKEMDNTRRKAMSEIGIFAKVGNGPEFLWLYGGNTADPPVLEDYRVQRIQMTIRYLVSVSSDKNITVTLVDDRTSYASVNSVNRVQDTVNKFKTGTVSELDRLISTENLGALLGKIVKTNNDVDNLSTPGIYQYTTNMASKGISSSYGFILVFSNGVGTLGQAGHFTWQLFVGTNGRMWVRKRINSEAWNVTDVANGNVLTALLRKFGLDEWGATVAINTCPSGTNFGEWLKRKNGSTPVVPIGFSIVRDMNSPVKEVFVWKPSDTYCYAFAPHWDGNFYVASLTGGTWKPWANLSQHTKLSASQSNQDFGDYLKSDAVPVGISMQKDSKSGAFGTATKMDNNNVMFSGTLRKGNKTYQVVMSIVNGIKPSTFTEWALTD
jgi:hypothetical protein|nr:MAG TPA: tail-collar fiber protein [Caudoviricetes sp.]